MVNNSKIIQLTERIEEIRLRCFSNGNALINAYRWNTNKDLRITSNKRLTRLMIGLNVSFIYLSNSDQEKMLGSIRLSFKKDGDILQYLLINELFLKMGFVSSLFFIVESVLRDYLRFIDKESYKTSKGIMTVCNCLLGEKLEWGNIIFDCQSFNFLRLIRNTLHNNGVHISQNKKEKNISIEYKGKDFAFSEGKRPNFVTWDLLLDITDDMRSLLFQIANNKTIRSIPGLILDAHSR